jgi:hypothetical protein
MEVDPEKNDLIAFYVHCAVAWVELALAEVALAEVA